MLNYKQTNFPIIEFIRYNDKIIPITVLRGDESTITYTFNNTEVTEPMEIFIGKCNSAKYVTVKEAIQITGKTERTIRRWIENKTVNATWNEKQKRWYIPFQEIYGYISIGN